MAFITRCPTVVSFQQLQEDDKCCLAPAGSGEQPVFGPDSPVALCAGQKIAKYSYAVEVSVKLPRYSSADWAVALVPDCDNARSPSCSTSSDGALDSSSNTTSQNQDDAGASTEEDDVFTSSLVPTAPPSKPTITLTTRASAPATALAHIPAAAASRSLGALHHQSLLDTVLLALWEDCAERGLFRYDVTACPTKVLPGVYGFVAQLNEGRATKKRPTEFRVDQVIQPFDESKFNFKKAYMKEVLFQFEPSHNRKAHLSESSRASASPNLVLINVSPIEYGHVLLVPRVLDCLPQLVDPSTILLALHFCREAANPYMRVGYNSLGAYATINHLHFQAYYLAAPFPCERAPTAPIRGLKRKRGQVLISRLVGYPVLGFVVEAGAAMCDAAGLAEVAEVVGQACLAMQRANIPHNLLIADSGARVFIWPQCFAEKQARGEVPAHILDTGVNPAVFEISGHMVLKRAEDYEAMSQASAWEMLAQVSLDEEALHRVAMLCFAPTYAAVAASAGKAAVAIAGCGVEVQEVASACKAEA